MTSSVDNRHFTWSKSLRGSYSLYNMDIEFDSDLGEIEEVEIIGHVGGTICEKHSKSPCPSLLDSFYFSG